jgi:hypothetical protein
VESKETWGSARFRIATGTLQHQNEIFTDWDYIST